MFIDDAITLEVVEVMMRNSQSVQLRQDFERDAADHNQITLNSLPSNQGREFTVAHMSDYCDRNSITQEFTVTYSPNQTGTAQCPRKTVMNPTRLMMNGKRLPQSQWDAVFRQL